MLSRACSKRSKYSNSTVSTSTGPGMDILKAGCDPVDPWTIEVTHPGFNPGTLN